MEILPFLFLNKKRDYHLAVPGIELEKSASIND
jgi:hypothetical protein